MLPQNNYFRTIIHWVLVVLILSSIGVGWYLQFQPQSNPGWAFFNDLHITLGLASVVLVVLKILLWLLFSKPTPLGTSPGWQAIIIKNLYLLIYVCVFILGISGFLQAISSASPNKFWGLQMPTWETGNLLTLDSESFYSALHESAAFALTVLVVIQAGMLLLSSFQYKKSDHDKAPKKLPRQSRKKAPQIHSKVSSRLIRYHKIFGIIGFCVQLVLVVTTALLLLFAVSGLTSSPELTDGTLVGIFNFVLLSLTMILFLFYTRSARKIVFNLGYYVETKKTPTPWLLKLCLGISFIGTLAGFFGVVATIELLFGKTISQPPGIAITDPTAIVRALDIIVLIINFSLLIAHFIGGAISLWINILASRVLRALLISSSPLTFPQPLQDRNT